MRILALAVLALAIGGCSRPATYRLVAQCELEAMRVYPAQTAESSAEASNYLRVCMEAHGHEFDLKGRSCIPTMRPEHNPACYDAEGAAG